MSDQERCCGTCRYHRREYGRSDDWICDNEMSPYYSDYTEYNDDCGDYEERERSWI